MNNEYDETRKGNILIIDDSPNKLRTLFSKLKKHGYNVSCVSDGEMALHAIRSELPDIILMEVVIPIINGYKLCEVLKTNQKTRHIPIIFISALDGESDKVKAFQLGGIDYITKPFFVEEVLVRVETQLNIYRQKKQFKKILSQHITRKNAVEAELKRYQTLLAGVLNSSIDGVAVFEAIRGNLGKIVDFRWIVVNPVAAMTVGETRKRLEGKLLMEKLPGHLFEGLFDLFVEVVESCIVLDREHLYGKDLSWFHVVAVKLGDGFAMTFRDITERKQMEIALKDRNQELKLQVNVDSLTQISNRRRFDEYISQEWLRCAREKEYLSVILCDVDYFKFYNDHYGHQAGDDCLYKVAQAMSKVVKRPADEVFRYGGEEFSAILPFTNGEGAVKIAGDIRQEILSLKIPHNLSKIGDYVTVSIGVSSVIPNVRNNFSFESLIGIADDALYSAKSLGRNRVVYKSLNLSITNNNLTKPTTNIDSLSQK